MACMSEYYIAADTEKLVPEVYFFTFPNYKIRAAFSLRLDLLVTCIAVLDTGAGPKFFRYDALPLGSNM